MVLLSPYASDCHSTKGRLYEEHEDHGRSVFRRDCDRIIHSSAFRRLEYKTQVFINHEGDHYRTRLTHSLEVAQIARSLCRLLQLDEDLGEALALAHDLGHPPFGHSGEEALDEMMESYGGFDHNAQTLKILTTLEQRYAAFIGLNLTWETLEGVVKHNGPLLDPHASILAYNQEHDLELDMYPSLEAQVAAIADDIAYNNHDIDDGIRSKLIRMEDIRILPFIDEICVEVEAEHGLLPDHIMVHELNRRLIHRMIHDVFIHTRTMLIEHNIHHARDVRNCGAKLVCFSNKMEEHHQLLKQFLMRYMYMHELVQVKMDDAKAHIKSLFQHYMDNPLELPIEWQARLEIDDDVIHRAITICDFIAGMTDRYALEQ